ncbi:MAG: hypothetical protein HPY85_10775 [Anaerolineae bacterium]|nr:hypothetical protein [Anaerolineae bacterium]
MKKSLFVILFNIRTQTGRSDIFLYHGAHIDSSAAMNAAREHIASLGWEMKNQVSAQELKHDELIVAAWFERPGGLYTCVFQLPAQKGGWCNGAYFATITASSPENAKVEARKAFRLPPNVRANFLAVERVADAIVHEVCPREIIV